MKRTAQMRRRMHKMMDDLPQVRICKLPESASLEFDKCSGLVDRGYQLPNIPKHGCSRKTFIHSCIFRSAFMLLKS